MSRTIKFSDFALPANGTTDLYLVGYVEGEENTNVKISVNDLSFSVSGSAGVASVNGKNGLIQIVCDNGITLNEEGNILTISGQNITIDQSFDGTSQNPQSGTAIATQLENVAKTDTAATFKDDLIVWGDADLKWIYGQGLTINGSSTLNGTVIVEGRNISTSLATTESHIANSDIHVNATDKEYWSSKADAENLELHCDNSDIHVSVEEKETWTDWALTTENHTANEDIHITADERTTWNSAATNLVTLNGESLYTVESEPANSGECDAVIMAADVVPHDTPLAAICAPAVANSCTTPLWLVAYARTDSDSILLGTSANTNTWTTGEDVCWNFSPAISIPSGYRLQLFICADTSGITSTEAPAPGVYIALRDANTGSCSVRYAARWYSGRTPWLRFDTAAHVNDTTAHISTAERSTWNSAATNLATHTADTDIHITADERTTWDTAATNLATHTADTDIHITAADRATWNETSISHVTDTTAHLTQTEHEGLTALLAAGSTGSTSENTYTQWLVVGTDAETISYFGDASWNSLETGMSIDADGTWYWKLYQCSAPGIVGAIKLVPNISGTGVTTETAWDSINTMIRGYNQFFLIPLYCPVDSAWG